MAEEDWDGWKALTDRLGDTRAARRRRPLRHQHRRACSTASTRRRQLDPDQGQPDRHADRDARRPSSSARAAGYTAVMSPPLRRDRGHHDRRPRRRHRLRPDQDRRARALRPRGQVQPAAAHRGGARAATRRTRGARSSAADAVLLQEEGARARRTKASAMARRTRIRWDPSGRGRCSASSPSCSTSTSAPRSVGPDLPQRRPPARAGGGAARREPPPAGPKAVLSAPGAWSAKPAGSGWSRPARAST